MAGNTVIVSAAGMSDREDNNLAGRLSRYAKVSGAMGGIAARAAGERYLGIKVEREKARAHVGNSAIARCNGCTHSSTRAR